MLLVRSHGWKPASCRSGLVVPAAAAGHGCAVAISAGQDSSVSIHSLDFSDFCCLEKRIVIEVDGDSHAERSGYDAWRTQKLAGRGFRVLRFFNDELRNNEGVMEAIYE